MRWRCRWGQKRRRWCSAPCRPPRRACRPRRSPAKAGPPRRTNFLSQFMKLSKPNTANACVLRWVEETAKLCQPDRIFWCNGSDAEKRGLTAEAVAAGGLIQLNQEKLPGCYYHRSDPRSEEHTSELQSLR